MRGFFFAPSLLVSCLVEPVFIYNLPHGYVVIIELEEVNTKISMVVSICYRILFV